MPNVGIKDSWSFVSFVRANGKAKYAKDLTNKDGEVFSSIAIVDQNDKVKMFVNFSSNLGELSMAEVIRRKDELQVVQLESGHYKLCKKGESGWSDLDI